LAPTMFTIVNPVHARRPVTAHGWLVQPLGIRSRKSSNTRPTPGRGGFNYINHIHAGFFTRPIASTFFSKQREILAQVTSVWPSRVWLEKGDDGRGLCWSVWNQPHPACVIELGHVAWFDKCSGFDVMCPIALVLGGSPGCGAGGICAPPGWFVVVVVLLLLGSKRALGGTASSQHPKDESLAPVPTRPPCPATHLTTAWCPAIAPPLYIPPFVMTGASGPM